MTRTDRMFSILLITVATAWLGFATSAQETGSAYVEDTDPPAVGETTLPRDVSVASVTPAARTTITLLGAGRTIPWEKSGAGFVTHVPAGLTAPNAGAWVFRVSGAAGVSARREGESSR